MLTQLLRVFIFSGFIFSATVGKPVSARPVSNLSLAKGISEYRLGHYQKAVPELSQAAKELPRAAMGHYYLALALERLAQHDQAISEYKAAKSFDPDGPIGAYSNIAVTGLNQIKEIDAGAAAYNAKKFDVAVAHFQKSVSIDPADALSHYWLALTYDQMNKHWDAYREYAAAYRLDRNGPIGQRCLAATGATRVEVPTQINGKKRQEIQIDDGWQPKRHTIGLAGGNNFLSAGSPIADPEPPPKELVATPYQMILDPHSRSGKYIVVRKPMLAPQDKLVLQDKPLDIGLSVQGKLLRH